MKALSKGKQEWLHKVFFIEKNINTDRERYYDKMFKSPEGGIAVLNEMH
jgi:hypothetical protein